MGTIWNRNGKKWKMMLKYILILILMFMQFGCTKNLNTDNIQIYNNSQYDNSNILNGGYIVEDSEWLYYTKFSDNSTIYKEKIGGGEVTKLTDGHYGYNLNLCGEYIYYIAGSPGYIHRVNVNTKVDSIMYYKNVANLIVTDKNMYFRLSEDDDWGKLYKADLSGNNIKLLADNVINFAVEDNYIYFISNADKFIYKIDINGKNKSVVVEKQVYYIDVYQNLIYYTDIEKGYLHSVETNGNNNTLLLENDCNCINVAGEYIYYSNFSDLAKIYRSKLDGSQNQLLIDMKHCGSLNVTDSFIVFRIPQSNGGFFRANIDGSNIVKQ